MNLTKNNPARKYKSMLAALAATMLAVHAVSALDYPATVLADNPVAYFRLEETADATAADSSASGLFPGVYVAGGSFPLLGQPGITTNSIGLSSSQSASVTIGYYPELNQPGPFSFEIWARPISVPTGGNYRCPIGNSPAFGTATQSGWYVYQTPGPGSTFALVTPTGDVFINSPSYTLSTWYHLAGTFNGTVMRFFINGVEAVGSPQTASAYVANSVNNAGVNVFGLGQRGDGYGIFDGNLDEAAYYTNALTPAQILTHYQVGTNSFRVAILPPSILTEPVSTNKYAGQTARFVVLADGTAPLGYQWYKGENAIVGATDDELAFTCVPADDGTIYSVVVTNSVGSVTSAPVTLTVSTELLIVAPLTSITRNVGSAAAFTIVAEGASPISYQWHRGDATPINGATNQSLWLTNVQLADDGSTYYVSIINPYTTVDSAPATLNVQARAVDVSTNRYAKVVLADGPIAYWRLDEADGSAIATDAVGSFDGTYLPNAGSFSFNAPSGIPNETNAALGVTGGAVVNIPYAMEINPTGPFTVEGWFKAASVTSGGNDYRTVFSSISNPYGAGPTGWLVYQTAGNNWSWWPYNGYYAGIQLTDSAQVVPNQWYHLGLVYDGTTFTLFVDGVAKASGTDSGFVQNGNVPAGSADYNYNYNTRNGLPLGSGAMVLGQRVDNAFGPFLGNIDDVAVYNKALTPQQIRNHFANSTSLTLVKSGNNVVVSWPTGTLQAAANVSGVYTNVPGATSPFTNTVGATQVFYRVQLQ